MKFVLVLALFAVAAFAQSWSNCGSNDAFVTESFSLEPSTLVPGMNATVQLTGQLNSAIDSAVAHVSITYLGVKVFSKSGDLCPSPIACPAAGPVDFTTTAEVPSYLPRGSYTANVKVTDGTGAELACVNVKVGVSSEQDHLEEVLVSDELVAKINAHRMGTWRAARHPRFEGLSRKELRAFLGAKLSEEPLAQSITLHAEATPDNFDSSVQWGSCVHPIRDQEQCGSCWAFSASEALSDRFCIASNGTVDVVMSPEDMVSCDKSNYGCDGGYLNLAWKYLTNTGIVSDACFPYTAGTGTAPACATSCVNGDAFKKYRAKAGTTVQPRDVASIQTLIMTSGPVQAAFSVYSDFFSYSSGVYSHTTGTMEGGHAIKITGWGVTENGTPYWIVANSWGTTWGINGFFWILRGSNECGIESQVIAALPAL